MTTPEFDDSSADKAPVDGAHQASGDSRTLQSVARRRALIKGLGKGAALGGAAAPLSSLAGYGDRKRLVKTDNKNYHCTVSGHMSVLLSAGGTLPPACYGKPRSHYKSSSGKCSTNDSYDWPNWKKNLSNKAICYTHSSKSSWCSPRDPFKNVFGGTDSTMIGIYCNDTSGSEPSHWVTALLNADNLSNDFPYSPEEVIAFYKDAQKRASALAFFRDWLSRG